MKVLGSLGGIILGGYFLLNPSLAFSKTAAEVSDEIKVCYDKSYVIKFGDAQKRIAKDKCARRAIQRYADQDLGNKDGNVTNDEINKAILMLKEVVNKDLEEKLNKLYPGVGKSEKIANVAGEELKPTAKEEKETKLIVGADLEIVAGEIKIVKGDYKLKFKVDAQTGEPYSLLVLEGDNRFKFFDKGNDNKFDSKEDCIEYKDKKFCHDDIIKKSRAFVGAKETTSLEYFISLKERFIRAYTAYILENFDKSKAQINKEKRQIIYSDGRFGFFIADSDNDGLTDTFSVKKGSLDGDVLIDIYNDKSQSTVDILGGLYDNLANR